MPVHFKEATKVWRSEDTVSEGEYRGTRAHRLRPLDVEYRLSGRSGSPFDQFVVARLMDTSSDIEGIGAHDFVILLKSMTEVSPVTTARHARPAFWATRVKQVTPNEVARVNSSISPFSELAISSNGIILAIDRQKDGLYPAGMGHLLSLRAGGMRDLQRFPREV